MPPPSKAQIRKAIADSKTAADKLTTIGMPVSVTLDDGTALPTTTASLPWQLGHGAWVCKIVGKPGGFDCARIHPMQTLHA